VRTSGRGVDPASYRAVQQRHGTDAARNLVTLLRGTPKNTTVVLAKYHRMDPRAWAHSVTAIGAAAKVSNLSFLSSPIPAAKPIRAAHDDGISVWDLPRRGNTKEFLDAVETVVHTAFKQFFSRQPMPAMPRRRAGDAYVPGWSDDEEA
jgi:hypothetical protein